MDGRDRRPPTPASDCCLRNGSSWRVNAVPNISRSYKIAVRLVRFLDPKKAQQSTGLMKIGRKS